MAINNKNEIVVTDFHNHSVKVYFIVNMFVHFYCSKPAVEVQMFYTLYFILLH